MIKGWGYSKVERFTRMWLDGDTISQIAEAFDLTPRYTQAVRQKLRLPPRVDGTGKYRGSQGDPRKHRHKTSPYVGFRNTKRLRARLRRRAEIEGAKQSLMSAHRLRAAGVTLGGGYDANSWAVSLRE